MKIKLHCDNCGSEWTVDDKFSLNDICPFCNKKISKANDINYETSSISDILKNIYTKYSCDILKDGDRLYALLTDLISSRTKELRLLKIVCEEGLTKKFLSDDYEFSKKELIYRLEDEFMLSSSYANEVTIRFEKSLGIESKNVNVDTTSNIIKKEQNVNNLKDNNEIEKNTPANQNNIEVSPKVATDNTEKNKQTQNIPSTNQINIEVLNKEYLKKKSEYKKFRDVNKFNLAREYSEKGSSKALSDLGVYLLNGTFGNKDINEAIKCIEKAAEFNDPRSLIILGDFYNDGENGFTTNFEKALKLYEKAMYVCSQRKHIDTEACYFLGQIYLFGRGVNKNKDKRYEFTRQAAVFGYEKALYELGCYFRDKEDYVQAFKYFSECIEKGYFEAFGDLASCYFYGKGTDKDISEAFSCAKKGALCGYPKCKLILGKIYTTEQNEIPVDYQKGISLLKEAYSEGEDYAGLLLGEIYFFNEEVEDISSAISYLNEAKDNGYLAAYRYLGLHYFYEDEKKAFDLFKEADAGGDKYSCDFLAYFYYVGINNDDSFVTDKKMAAEFANKAIKNDCASYAYAVLGHLYYEGDRSSGIPVDKTLAFDYFQKGAQCSDSVKWLCASRVVQMAYEGDGIEKNLELAEKYAFMLCPESEYKYCEVKTYDDSGLSQFIVGLYFRYKDWEKAFTYFVNGAKKGNILCFRELAYCFKYGFGCKKSWRNYKFYIKQYEESLK